MDYFGILKKAWDVTWRNKSLWILGFFAVVSSGTSSTSNTFRWQESSSSADIAPFGTWLEQNIGLLIVLGVALFVFGVVLFVLGIAARGGLAHLVNEIEEGRSFKVRDGWAAGFRYWGRTFMIGFLLGLPLVLVVVLMVLMLFGAGLGLALGIESASAVTGLGFGGAMCCLLPVFVILITVLSFAISVIGELAVRYGVLHDMSFGKAIRQGWDDLRVKRTAAVMWLVMLLPQLAYSAVTVVLSIVVMAPAFLLFVAGAELAAVLVALLFVLALMVPGAIYNTFYSASWTVFFRRMTGAEVVAEVPKPGVGQGYMPPPPASTAPPAISTSGDGPEA